MTPDDLKAIAVELYGSAREIEVTPEMVRAGLAVFCAFDARFEEEEAAVVRLFRAMARASIHDGRLSIGFSSDGLEDSIGYGSDGGMYVCAEPNSLELTPAEALAIGRKMIQAWTEFVAKWEAESNVVR